MIVACGCPGLFVCIYGCFMLDVGCRFSARSFRRVVGRCCLVLRVWFAFTA